MLHKQVRWILNWNKNVLSRQLNNYNTFVHRHHHHHVTLSPVVLLVYILYQSPGCHIYHLAGLSFDMHVPK